VRTTTLGTHGPQVGVIGLGCMGMTFSYDVATPRDDDTSIAVIRAALDLGVTLIDTADVYGPFTNEELVGRALAPGYREQAVLATKVGLIVSDPTGGPDNSSSSTTAAPNTSASRSTTACAGSTPTMWTSTSCTGWTRTCRWRRPGARWPKPWRPAR
jgi:aryl-alcohol dehydrogenase-like predicted oxidoreductase